MQDKTSISRPLDISQREESREKVDQHPTEASYEAAAEAYYDETAAAEFALTSETAHSPSRRTRPH